jgi:hypothetical protein
MSKFQIGTRVFSWGSYNDFRTVILAMGGSGSVHSGTEISTDCTVSGRYAREYSAGLPDLEGRSISFYCTPCNRGTYGTPGFVPSVVLIGCPWGTSRERDGTYRALANAGCATNDMRSDPELTALVAQARSMPVDSIS